MKNKIVLFRALAFFSVACSLAASAWADEKGPWESPPVVQIEEGGGGLRITVEPNLLMERKRISEIKSVTLETSKGKFLGRKTFTEKDIKRRAEFLLESSSKMKAIRVKALSSVEGEWQKVFPLKETGKLVSAYSSGESSEKKGG